MKKLFLLGLSSLVSFSASAQTLEERVEALEYAGYEDIFRFSGQLEMRFDSVNIENNKEYTSISDLATYLGTSGASGTTTTPEDDWNNGFARMFFKLNMESKPSDKLSFYGQLAVAKHMNAFNAEGSELAGYDDIGAGLIPTKTDGRLWLTKAFVNYNFTNNFTFTFGRLPTAGGAPKHLTRDEAMAGAYPTLAYSAIFDGVAFTYSKKSETGARHAGRIVWTPTTRPNLASDDPVTSASGGKVKSMDDWLAFMYEYERTNTAIARKSHLIAQYMQANGSESSQQALVLELERYAIYWELLGIASSKFDLALSYSSNKVTSEGAFAPGFAGYLGLDDGDSATGASAVITTRYSINQKSKIGIEYVKTDANAFTFDAVNTMPISLYGKFGTGYHLFYNHSFDGGLKWNLGYMTFVEDTTYQYLSFFGDKVDIDRTTTAAYTGFVANF